MSTRNGTSCAKKIPSPEGKDNPDPVDPTGDNDSTLVKKDKEVDPAESKGSGKAGARMRSQ